MHFVWLDWKMEMEETLIRLSSSVLLWTQNTFQTKYISSCHHCRLGKTVMVTWAQHFSFILRIGLALQTL